jgi:hypothetical protein
VLREAIRGLAGRVERLTGPKRLALLRAFDRLVPAIEPRPASEVLAEIRAVRTARRCGGRRAEPAARR